MTYNVYCQECLDDAVEKAHATGKESFFAPHPDEPLGPRPYVSMTGIQKPCKEHGGEKDPEEWFEIFWPSLKGDTK